MRSKDFIRWLKVNANVVHMQLDGLSNADLLLQPDMRGNCANLSPVGRYQ